MNRLRNLPRIGGLHGWVAGLLSITLLLGATLAVQAQPAPAPSAEGPTWSALSPAQQAALAPLKRDWSGLDDTRKQKWLEIGARFPSMPADERQRVQERMTEWSRMSPDERGRARLQYQQAKEVSPQQRQSRWDAYMALPEAERRALAQSASTVPRVAQPSSTPERAAQNVPGARPTPSGKMVEPGAGKSDVKAVAPVLLQAKPGASTTLISNTAKPPAHVKPGEPKIAAGQEVVNRSTLLPKSGPQSKAAARPAAASASAR